MSTPERPQHSRSRKLTSLTVDEIMRIAVAFEKSQTFKNKGNSMTAAQLFIVIVAGQEMGIGPSQSVMGIKMIEGKPEISANLMAAMVKASGKYDYAVEYGDGSDPDGLWCEVSFYSTEDGEIIGQSRFSKADALQASLWRNNYLKFWRNMLFARALSNGVKWFVPDALFVAAYHEGEIEGDTEAPVPELPKPEQPRLATHEEVERANRAGLAPGETTVYEDLSAPEEVAPEDVTVEPDREPAVVAAGPQYGYDGPETGNEEMERMVEEEALVDLATEPPPPVVAPPPTVTQSENVRTITGAQVGLAHVRARAAQLTPQRYAEIVEATTGVRHTDKIPANPRELFDALLRRLDAEAQLVDRPAAVKPDPEDD